MDLLTTFGIAVGLAMDAFAVSISTGLALGKVSGRQTFRLSFHQAQPCNDRRQLRNLHTRGEGS